MAVTVKNTGNMDGNESIQVYIQDVTGSLVRPVKELKGFKKVFLAVGDECKVKVDIKKQELGFYNNEGTYLLEDGLFRIYAGGNSRDCLCEEINIKFTL